MDSRSKTYRMTFGENLNNLLVGPRICVSMIKIFLLILNYVLAKEVFGKKIAFLSTIVLSLSPLINYYSSNVNVDIFLVLTSTLFYYLTYLTNKDKKYIWMSGTTAPLLYLSKTTSLFIFLSAFLFLISFRKKSVKKNIKHWILAYTLGAILLMVLWPYARNPLNIVNNLVERADYSISGHTTYHFGIIHEKAIFWVGPALVFAKLPLIITLFIALFAIKSVKQLIKTKKLDEKRAFLSLWFFTPLILMGLVNIIANHYTLLVVVPAYLIACFELVKTFEKNKNFKTLAGIFVALILLKLVYYWEMPGLNTAFFLKPEFVSLIPETGYAQTLQQMNKKEMLNNVTISDSYDMGKILEAEIYKHGFKNQATFKRLSTDVNYFLVPTLHSQRYDITQRYDLTEPGWTLVHEYQVRGTTITKVYKNNKK